MDLNHRSWQNEQEPKTKNKATENLLFNVLLGLRSGLGFMVWDSQRRDPPPQVDSMYELEGSGNTGMFPKIFLRLVCIYVTRTTDPEAPSHPTYLIFFLHMPVHALGHCSHRYPPHKPCPLNLNPRSGLLLSQVDNV